jgi:serine/threonine-protein kinase
MLNPNALCGYIVDNRYQLADLRGEGSFGWVYAADELAFGSVIGQVAVKLIRIPNNSTYQAVIREVQAMRQLAHPNLVACLGAGQISGGLLDGCVYIATELASETLEARLTQPKPMTPDEVRQVTEHLASALAYLHERGAVHRDVKPSNILRVGNWWKLGDFGLVRGFTGTALQASGLKGTVLYMSPEAMEGTIGPFVDVWALGVVVQECLTGQLPYPGGSDAEIIAAALTKEPTIASHLPEPFQTIVRGCLTKDRHARWTAKQVLQHLQGNAVTQAAMPTTSPSTERPLPAPAPRESARLLVQTGQSREVTCRRVLSGWPVGAHGKSGWTSSPLGCGNGEGGPQVRGT